MTAILSDILQNLWLIYPKHIVDISRVIKGVKWIAALKNKLKMRILNNYYTAVFFAPV